jgi:hypothetical protein
LLGHSIRCMSDVNVVPKWVGTILSNGIIVSFCVFYGLSAGTVYFPQTALRTVFYNHDQEFNAQTNNSIKISSSGPMFRDETNSTILEIPKGTQICLLHKVNLRRL